MNHKIPLPFRIKALLTSAYLSIAIICLYVLAVLYTISTGRTVQFVPLIFFILIFISFFLHSFTIVYFVKRVYPAGEIPKPPFVVYNFADVVVIIIIVFSILSTIGILISPDNLEGFASVWHKVIGKIVIIAIGLLILAQVHIVIESRRLIKLIRRNHRAELFESI